MNAVDPRQQLGEFAHYLREHGFALGYAELELMARSAAALPLTQWPRIESLWRGIASGSHKQWLKYPDLHRAFWFPHLVKGSTKSSGLTRLGRSLPELVQQMQSEMGQTPPAPGASAKPIVGMADTPGAGELEESAGPQRAQGGASRTAPLDQRDFADWMPADMDRFEPLVEALKRRLRAQLMRRLQHHQERGLIHLRRSLRAALATGGELVKLHHVRRQRRQPRVTVLVDVSRSMEVHAQFFLRLSRAFVEVMDARAFVFHTRLAEVTPLMKRRSERVQEKINAVTFGFGGGTRIATCLEEALHLHLRRSLARGDLFLVFSDGYDTDEPQALAEVLAQVRARGARVGWLHPTVAVPQSEAMHQAAPFVTRFLPAHNLASLMRLPELLA
ncbi:MAG: VWA domain-containing protein [Gammaproteobacteria bacterium]|nr:VWA domain-containing protein [Gammaproteobacteria bacterium]MBU0786281.1 VWA domain-containing protein [Gammaproteobacteria bacterium]MBU0814499.1 VWA domain-containing protein [Gammaproteobacteria bacterium]MBU1786658.1 VWA domain-containing protein [Gammaproteobacteria bacterium]